MADVLLRLEKDRRYREVIFQLLLRLRECIEDVIPSLGTIARLYGQDGRVPDAFFRGATKLLEDLVSADEYRALKVLVDLLLQHTKPNTPTLVEIGIHEGQCVLNVAPDVSAGVLAGKLPWTEENQEIAPRLFRLLRDHHLASEPEGRIGTLAPDNCMRIERVTFERLHQILV